jgi:hypothetical protein
MSSWLEIPSSPGRERFEDIKRWVEALPCVDALVHNYMFVADADYGVVLIVKDWICPAKLPHVAKAVNPCSVRQLLLVSWEHEVIHTAFVPYTLSLQPVGSRR